MYACIHLPTAQQSVAQHSVHDLLALALDFSPRVEQASPQSVVFSIAELRKLIGSPHQIASVICRLGHERKLAANLAIASTPDTVILLAHNFPGVTVVAPGEERFKLASIPLHALFTHDVNLDPALLDVLHRWGLKTCEDLAAMPEHGLAERLGQPGVYLRSLACGGINRPLRVAPPVTRYKERMELEHPLHLLEPLLFLLSRVLSELGARLRSQSQAARAIKAHLDLEDHEAYHCQLEFPVPLDDTQTMLKLLQLHLERHPPEAAVTAFTLRVDPASPRRIQGGMFLPPTPAPDKLQVTIARIAGMVGQENVGTPMLLDTHRPDAFQMTTLNTSPPDPLSATAVQPSNPQVLRLAMRLFRPALHARVRLAGSAPKIVSASGVKGNVLRCAGPWKTSGEWWTCCSWNREEWDVALDDGALYRIYCEIPAREWYVDGVYD
jgi:protein ImuB